MKNGWRLWKKYDGNIMAGKMILNKDFKEFFESLNDNNLKKNKQATGRHQDLADLENLE